MSEFAGNMGQRQLEWFNDEPFDWLWSRSSQPFGAQLQARAFEFRRDWSGVSSAKFIEDIVKDGSGTPISGAVVTPFRKSTDPTNPTRSANCQEGTVVISAPDGAYRVGVPTEDQYYLRAQDPVTGFVGTTIDTLVGV